MNFNYICFYDFETGSKNASKTQPTQLASCIIDARKLNIVEGGIFNSYIQPIFDPEECKKYGVDELQDEALKITNISIETLKNAPTTKVVWGNFCSFVNQFNPKKDRWGSPIPAGYNINNFDDIIVNRLCGGNKLLNNVEKELYKFGPWDVEYGKNSLFHPFNNIDLMKLIWYWFENDREVKSLSMDHMREKFGINKSNAHNALCDVLQGAFLLIKFLRMERSIMYKSRPKFEDSFTKENKEIERILNESL